ncbi:MAG: putative selenate ABC transporter substrate-binding protein [Acidaminobacteraceae bacterium]
MKRIGLIILSIVMLISIAGCAKEEKQVTFKIGAIPDQNVSELSRRFDAFSEYLSNETGLDVEYVQSQDYASLVTAFNRGEIQLAWFGGLTGVQARSEVAGAEAIAQRPRDEKFTSVFIADKSLNIRSLEDIKGKSLTFGSESSTSGHLMPRFFMMEAGLNPEEILNASPNYSGSHDKTIKLVESGAFEVGALNAAVWESAVENATVDLELVDAFYITPEYYDYNWTINDVKSVYGDNTKENVKNALLSMGDEQAEILELFHTEKFIESNNANYDAIKNVAIELGIIRE